jgi:hypothetical protein
MFAWKCEGLDRAALQQRLEPSAITLGGLLKHLALTEDYTFNHKLRGQPPGPPWDDADWEEDPDWEWHSAVDDSPEELYGIWQEAVSRSRATVDNALAKGDLGQRGWMTSPEGDRVSLRRLLIDLIEEYARHVGHADLIRESVDGVVGEDPPDGFVPP